MDAEFDFIVEDNGTDMEESKRPFILEGPIHSFPGNASITQYFQAALAENRINGDEIALIDEEKKHTFHELDLFSTKLARIIRIELGGLEVVSDNPDGDIVIGLCLPASDKLILTIFAILKLGAAYLPFDIHFPEDRVMKIVENSRPLLIISDPHASTIAKFNPVSKYTKVIDINTLILKALEGKISSSLNMVEPVPGLASKAERVGIVMYTSGSTGVPKGVRITHRTIMNRLFWQWKTFPFKQNERCCFKTALTFVDSVTEIFEPLLQGFHITIFGKHITSHPNTLIQRIYDCKITRLVLVPSLLRAILSTLDVRGEEARSDLRTVALWICSGETLSKNLLDEFFVNFPTDSTICNFYGSTEILDVTYEVFSSPKEVKEKLEGVHVPIGKCTFNTTIYVLDEKMNLSKDGEIGEIYVAGYNLCSGYVGSAGVDKFVPNPFTKSTDFNQLFRTGDFGRIRRPKSSASGVLFYEGRLDSQVKVRGQRIDTNEIEATLAHLTDLIEAIVVLIYHRDQEDQTIVAFVLPKDKKVTVARIDMMIKTKLKPIEFPEIRLVDEIPLLVNGKVNRQRLLQQYEDRRMKRMQFNQWQTLRISAAQLDATIALVQTIAQVTGTSEHDIVADLDDSFFNVGGTSLNSIMVISKLRLKRYQISIPDFLSARTVREMIARVHPVVPGPQILGEAAEEAASATYYAERINDAHKDAVKNIIAFRFSRKSDLDVCTVVTYTEFSTYVENMWYPLVNAGYSFVVCRVSDKKIVAASLNFDAADKPKDIKVAHSIQTSDEKLPKGKGKLWHSILIGTAEGVDKSENVSLVLYMEEEIIRRARENGFSGIMTTNTSPLTQQVCEDLLGYEKLCSYQVNTYIARDGSKPFLLLPDTQVAVCCWKKLEESSHRN